MKKRKNAIIALIAVLVLLTVTVVSNLISAGVSVDDHDHDHDHDQIIEEVVSGGDVEDTSGEDVSDGDSEAEDDSTAFIKDFSGWDCNELAGYLQGQDTGMIVEYERNEDLPDGIILSQNVSTDEEFGDRLAIEVVVNIGKQEEPEEEEVPGVYVEIPEKISYSDVILQLMNWGISFELVLDEEAKPEKYMSYISKVDLNGQEISLHDLSHVELSSDDMLTLYHSKIDLPEEEETEGLLESVTDVSDNN